MTISSKSGVGLSLQTGIVTSKDGYIQSAIPLREADEGSPLYNDAGQLIEYKDLFNFSDIVPVSAKNGDNVKTLVDVVRNYLNDDIKYFKDDAVTSSSVRFMISEYVREKLFNHLEQEIPHTITCFTTGYEEKEKIVNVNVDIIVDRESLKKIIIGHNGEMLKNVGMESRKDIEKMLDKKVYLELTSYITSLIDLSSVDLLVKAVMGGIINGYGLGLVFKTGYTTGGTDIINCIFKKMIIS